VSRADEWRIPVTVPIRCVEERGSLRVTVTVEELATNDDVAALPEMLSRAAKRSARYAAARLRGDPEAEDEQVVVVA